VEDREIGDHARGLDALVVAALEPHFPVVLVRIDLERIHAQALGERRHRTNVADGGERQCGVRLQVNVGVRLDVLVEVVGAARVVQTLTRLHRVGRVEDVDHVEQLLPEVPGGLAGLTVVVRRILGRRAVERDDQTFGADAVTQRFEVLRAALLVGAAQRRHERLARASVADLAETRRRLALHLLVGVLDQLDQHVGVLRLRMGRQHGGDELPHGRALVAGHRRELVDADQIDDLVGIERDTAAQALNLREVAEPVKVHHFVERARVAEHHECPGNLRLGAGARRLQRGEQAVLRPVGHRTPVLGERERSHALHRIRRVRERRRRERHALRVLGPRELLQRFAAHLVTRLLGRPLAPERDLLGLGLDEDVLLDLLALLDGEPLRVLLGADEQERRRTHHHQDADDDDRRIEATLLEVAVTAAVSTTTVTATGRNARAWRCSWNVVVGRPFGQIDVRQRERSGRLSRRLGQVGFEHGGACGRP
jgi:hypothetical protein